MKMQTNLARRFMTAATLLVLAGQACTVSLFENPLGGGTTPPTAAIQVASPTPQVVAQTTFVVSLPEALGANESLAIAVMDEVTGLSLNATQYPMNARDELTYTASLPLPYNAIVKYRYIRRGGAQIPEDTSRGEGIRYRMFMVTGPAEVRDIIADWGDKNYGRPQGSIMGQINNGDTGSALPNLLVTAGGMQSLTDSRGRFELNGLPVGTHTLVAYSLDGMYQTFQQGAMVAEGQTTLVDLKLRPLPLVNITFNVAVPEATIAGVPVRMAGSLMQLGNTFADLRGGVSTSPERMPVMSLQPDGRYTVTLALPAGAYIQYKYTLGDGYWNAEHKADGAWNVRELVVPAVDTTLDEKVTSWEAGDSPILFEVSVPAITPVSDIVYIQFNTFGWMEPLPMWPLGNNRWVYKLYSPLNVLGSFSYRYCRNGQCGSADDVETAGGAPVGRTVQTSLIGQDIQDTVGAWKWFENPEPLPLVGVGIRPRASDFKAGVEFNPVFRPNYSYFMPQALANTQAIGANLVVFTPRWTFSSNGTELSPAPGQNPLWMDTLIMLSQARAMGVKSAVFPGLDFPNGDAAAFWSSGVRDAAWWQTWFSRYRAFAINFADLAAQGGAQSLILGGEGITPALPGGKLQDGSNSNPPADAEAQWKALIAETRTHYSGEILWALPYSESVFQAPPEFLSDVDGIYLLFSPSLSAGSATGKDDYIAVAGSILDQQVAPFVIGLKKPVTLAVSYPSAAGAAAGCVPNGGGGCLDWGLLDSMKPDAPSASLDLQTQADLYEAILTAMNERSWISGFVSRGYHAPVALQDKSTSAHSKPVADVLWYWYPRLLGRVQ